MRTCFENGCHCWLVQQCEANLSGKILPGKPAVAPFGSRQAISKHVLRRGFSLLEVILALAILAGAVAVLGELARLGIRNARAARYTTQAQLLCESKLAEITAGITMPEPVQGAPCENVVDPADPRWLYTIEVQPVDEQGLVAVRVSVKQDLPPENRPIGCSLVRWIVDPGVEMSEEAAAEESDRD